MANRPSPNSLIHCSQCGEEYSATYKRCPFCGAKNAPQQSDPDRPASGSDLDDTYVFNGQGVFDDEPEENAAPVSPKGGKRLAEKSFSNPFANADINWPRVITFLCSLIIIVAAMVIVFTVVYPQLRGNKDPVIDNSQSPSAGATDPADASQGVISSQGPAPSGSADPSQSVEPSQPVSSNTLTGFTLSSYDFTLPAKGDPQDHHQLKITFDPKDWSGEVTWESSDERYATVTSKGVVTNVNSTATLHKVVITVTAGGISRECDVYCKGVPASQPAASDAQASAPPASNPPASNPPASEPPASTPPASEPPASEPPASDPPPTQSPSGSGAVTVGKKGVVANTGGVGVRVRAEPSASGTTLASLFDGDPITVLEDAGNGWYKIANGPTKGYIKGDYISQN